MSHPHYHALSTVKKYKGRVKDYIDIHSWFDESKRIGVDPRHRALRHHTEGIFQCEEIFGKTIVNFDGKTVPVRAIGEQHVLEDLGRVPSFRDWMLEMEYCAWMNRAQPLSQIFQEKDDEQGTDSSSAKD